MKPNKTVTAYLRIPRKSITTKLNIHLSSEVNLETLVNMLYILNKKAEQFGDRIFHEFKCTLDLETYTIVCDSDEYSVTVRIHPSMIEIEYTPLAKEIELVKELVKTLRKSPGIVGIDTFITIELP